MTSQVIVDFSRKILLSQSQLEWREGDAYGFVDSNICSENAVSLSSLNANLDGYEGIADSTVDCDMSRSIQSGVLP
jgi:hypothetical protein